MFISSLSATSIRPSNSPIIDTTSSLLYSNTICSRFLRSIALQAFTFLLIFTLLPKKLICFHFDRSKTSFWKLLRIKFLRLIKLSVKNEFVFLRSKIEILFLNSFPIPSSKWLSQKCVYENISASVDFESFHICFKPSMASSIGTLMID